MHFPLGYIIRIIFLPLRIFWSPFIYPLQLVFQKPKVNPQTKSIIAESNYPNQLFLFIPGRDEINLNEPPLLDQRPTLRSSHHQVTQALLLFRFLAGLIRSIYASQNIKKIILVQRFMSLVYPSEGLPPGSHVLAANSTMLSILSLTVFQAFLNSYGMLLQLKSLFFLYTQP